MKTKPTHTPGEWKLGIRQPNSSYFIYGPLGEEVADCDRLTNFTDENQANAQLIAASPELLDACKIAMELIKTNWPHEHGNRAVATAWGKLESAIEKANQ